MTKCAQTSDTQPRNQKPSNGIPVTTDEASECDGFLSEFRKVVKGYRPSVEFRETVEGFWKLDRHGPGSTNSMNLWDETGILGNHEVRYCRILGWVLDPDARHNLGRDLQASFLQEFLGKGKEIKCARVKREEVSDDGECRFDLTLTSGSYRLIIETKIGAPFSEGQLEGYRVQYPKADGLAITRSRDRQTLQQIKKNRFVHTTWYKVGQWLEGEADRCLTELSENRERSPFRLAAPVILKQFAESMKRL